VLNTPASDLNPTVSPDELRLYFASDRPGGQGLTDLYVSRRASRRSAWGTPENLGAVVNTSGVEVGPSLSGDGRLLFFQSSRPGGLGGTDIWVSRRADPADDFGWEAPVNLGPHVNTALDEAGSEYVPGKRHGPVILYFNRRQTPVPAAPFDIFSVPLLPDGMPTEPAAPVPELNTVAGDFGPELSSDGLELFLSSNRPGTLGGNDIWHSTRRSVTDAWSTPQNLGTPIASPFNDRQQNLSSDGRTLIFASSRPGGLGSDDLWMSTRVGGWSRESRDR
jgi:hypothetical protein